MNEILNLKKKVFNEKRRISICNIGRILLIVFSITASLVTIFAILGMLGKFSFVAGIKEAYVFWIIFSIMAIIIEAVIFWLGIIMVYLSSLQLGIKIRVCGLICGFIPMINLIMLGIIIAKTSEEVSVEKKKIELNESRRADEICKTKYPVLLVHGVFFRDTEIFNYWGRVPDELERNGATIYYGNHNSAASVDDSAKELEKRVLEIINSGSCEKLNVIAHSKGGLDMRTAISKTSIAPYIASLTTINTPHRGCEFADYLLSKIPKKEQQAVAGFYNKGAEKLGDSNPDFLAAVYDLTHANCEKRNEEVFDNPNIFYQSVGSKLNRNTSGKFPLNMSYALVKHFDGPNDGLVGKDSFEWGTKYRFIETKGKRGISHADMIDLNRENFKGFDVREFYVQLLAELKAKGF